jgi:hypothetical protein
LTLIDTSAWTAHLKTRGGHPGVIAALESATASSHPFIEGELMLAGAPASELLGGVEMLALEPHAEVRAFVGRMQPRPSRIGWVDAHLLYSALVHGHELLTLDGRLRVLWGRVAAGG